MKVLFAVNSESVSEAIIKKYQKDYREILSFKNVYYFNAILKEIQQDKTYDRIVISEDLEPFSSNNYESIDKFIFEKLDSISDEAHDSQGNEISIILIASDRHTKQSSFLVKIFGIGVYNALLGTDRSIEEVCRLINKPRTKKEAKMYYKIDTEDVNYKAENENEVSELEIRNILTHFKKLGKNSEKYASSFDNIASQYTEEQLKIIINCLPMSVKAILEESSQKYQEIMAANGVMVKGIKSSKNEITQDTSRTGLKIDIIENKLNQTKMTQPIVIPNSVKKTKSNVAKRVISIEQDPANVKLQKKRLKESAAQSHVELKNNAEHRHISKDPENLDSEIVRKKVRPERKLEDNFRTHESTKVKVAEKAEMQNSDQIIDEFSKNSQGVKLEKKKGRGRPKKEILEENIIQKPKGKRGRPKKKIFDEDELDKQDFDELDLEDIKLNHTNQEKLSSNEDLDELDLTQIDELDDLNSDNNISSNAEYAEESYDEFDDYDEYGEYKTVNSDEEDEIEKLYNNDIVLDNDSDETDEAEDEEQVDSDDDDILLSDLEDLDYDDADTDEEKNKETEEIDLQSSDVDNFDIYDETIDDNQNYSTGNLESIEPSIDYSMSTLNSVMAKDKKIVTFVGSPKNGTSFLVNNLAEIFSSLNINTAILDMTQNKNSYYIYTDNREELRKTAYTSIEKLKDDVAEGIRVNRNLTVYTSLPNDGKDYSNAEPILSTLVQNHSLILIDCDFDTDPSYFALCQEIYLVQSMDILTIQPFTSFLRDLKVKGVLEQEKIKIIINKELKVKNLTPKAIIGGMSTYNTPTMSNMINLFNKDIIRYCTIPFEEMAYSKYLESLLNCKITLKGLSKNFMNKLKNLGEMVYPLTSRQTFSTGNVDYSSNYGKNNFSSSINSTLNKMKKRKF